MIVYTFRTFKDIQLLKTMFGQVFVFDKLHEDLKNIQKQIADQNPDQIFGIASTKRGSRIEPLAINKFNKGVLQKNGPDSVELFVPQTSHNVFAIGKPSHTFCNWTMYNLQLFLNQQKLKTKLSFVHINLKDIGLLNKLLNPESDKSRTL